MHIIHNFLSVNEAGPYSGSVPPVSLLLNRQAHIMGAIRSCQASANPQWGLLIGHIPPCNIVSSYYRSAYPLLGFLTDWPIKHCSNPNQVSKPITNSHLMYNAGF